MEEEFFFIGKVKYLLKKGTKRATQGIQHLYPHRQNGQKRKGKQPNKWD